MKDVRGPDRMLDFMLRTGAYGDGFGFGLNAEGLSLSKLKAHPHGVDLGPLEPRIPGILRTESGKIERAPEPVLTLGVREELKQQHGFVHGGVVSYLVDNALTYAGGSVLGDSVTSEFKVNYIRPAMGERLIARATVLSSGKRQAVCQCKVLSADEKGERLVAVAQGTTNKVN